MKHRLRELVNPAGDNDNEILVDVTKQRKISLVLFTSRGSVVIFYKKKLFCKIAKPTKKISCLLHRY